MAPFSLIPAMPHHSLMAPQKPSPLHWMSPTHSALSHQLPLASPSLEHRWHNSNCSGGHQPNDNSANDADGDALTYSLLGAEIPGLTRWLLEPNPSDSAYHPGDDTQAITVNYGVSDGKGGSSQSSFVINFCTNDAPVASFNAALATTEGSAALTGKLSDVDANETLTYAF